MTTDDYRRRCRIAESCLPPAEYRTLLTSLHDEMLADIGALEQELATIKESLTAQEPVAWVYDFLNSGDRDEVIRNWITQDYADIEREKGFNVRPLYIRPPKREWIGLTDEDLNEIDYPELRYIGTGEYVVDGDSVYEFAKSIEAKLKEKNGGGV